MKGTPFSAPAMLPRLLCFLSDVERALVADDPSPGNGAWQANRTVNYHLKLARLELSGRSGDQAPQVRGAINLQGFTLADGTPCLKAALSWTGSANETIHAIYTKPGIDWNTEARRVASLWLAGPPAPAVILDTAPAIQPDSPPDRLASAG